MAKLRPLNTVFQAELLAIWKVCLWVSKTNQQVKVWSDSESSLHSFASIYTKSPIAQQTQEILLKSTNIKLEWIRAHFGYSCNEAADELAKKATQDGNPHIHLSAKKPYQESPTKRVHHPLAMEKQAGEFTKFCLKDRKFRQRPEIMFITGHVPFPT
ncbi:hypothetical protein AVEN_260119-1 [Araneus ventricosus]|uniref:RNase H type-1 domain-containing protein n=1 Tax=Araneus ventricosus TaxID=182803 RepID=A0A4Y2DII8_ARAVE|nr:hypothetical protein AVEN_260119-1 [Araneus ventricosus]